MKARLPLNAIGLREHIEKARVTRSTIGAGGAGGDNLVERGCSVGDCAADGAVLNPTAQTENHAGLDAPRG